MRNNFPSPAKKGGLLARSKRPVLPEITDESSSPFRALPSQSAHLAEKIALNARVLIIEGISGSGKDTFQNYLKMKLCDRDVYDYSEGEVLHSWKHFPIEGILKLRIQFMKLFIDHVRNVVEREKDAVFLLNRFHLSAYVTTISRQPELEREYDEIINILRTLPVHVFILHLDENEISRRSMHAERSGVWQKIQRQMVRKDGSRDRVERYHSQQKMILDVARRQQIPFSVINLQRAPDILAGWSDLGETQSDDYRAMRKKTHQVKIAKHKQKHPRTLKDVINQIGEVSHLKIGRHR